MVNYNDKLVKVVNSVVFVAEFAIILAAVFCVRILETSRKLVVERDDEERIDSNSECS